MGSNSFGTLFRITTWGESHGPAIGVVIDGCPAGLEISEEDIFHELKKRRPGTSPYTSPRQESDQPQILSGVFEGKTTGAPISISIANRDADSRPYHAMQDVLRPGHATYTYLQKYGHVDHRGGGRASARETAARVAAGAVAKKLLARHDISIEAALLDLDLEKLAQVQEEGDSLGGVIECVSTGVPAGLGDPIYDKLEAKLAYAMLSIPAARGVEFGAGFASANMRGSEHNDLFTTDIEGNVVTETNHAGGTLGGISTGMPLVFRVPFKPTSSIQKPQATLTTEKTPTTFTLPKGSRHDPCVAIRAAPVVEAMTALVLVDALLKQGAMYVKT